MDFLTDLFVVGALVALANAVNCVVEYRRNRSTIEGVQQ